MFPDDAKLRGAGRATSNGHGRGEQPRSTDRDGGGGGRAVVAVGGPRGTLYDSFELNAMVVRLNRLLNADGAGGGSGSGGARRPRKAAGSWLATPKVLFRKIKSALLAGRRGDG